MSAKNITWTVANKKGSVDPFNVTGHDLEDAVCNALVHLGWDITPALIKPEPEPESESEPEIHIESASDDLSSKDEFITSSKVIDLAKDHNLELMLSLNGFSTSRYLGHECHGFYSHKSGTGDAVEITADDFLRIYPNSHGNVWRVVQLSKSEPYKKAPQSLPVTIKGFFASCFYLATYSRLFYLG